MKNETLENRVFIHANSRLERKIAIKTFRKHQFSDPESSESASEEEHAEQEVVLVVGNSTIE